jgi:hypothetical protein
MFRKQKHLGKATAPHNRLRHSRSCYTASYTPCTLFVILPGYEIRASRRGEYELARCDVM